MRLDPSQPPTQPRDAASVILLRPAAGGAEVFLLRRHRRASFMSSAFVFPGGVADPSDRDPRETALRELFEEAGVLLTTVPVDAATRAAWRARVAAGASLAALLADANVALDLDAARYFAHWITPSAEAKRFSARFFVAALPPGQTPAVDQVETVEQAWVSPEAALDRAGELRLPPPQVRTMLELGAAARRGVDAVLELAAERARFAFPILPRFAPLPATPHGFGLLLPWDPEYRSAGTGEELLLPEAHPLAWGPSRFVLEESTWTHISAPSSQPAG
jgi:8-oxo-dGTP pyrophosphatase MutT (NUDIX family)